MKHRQISQNKLLILGVIVGAAYLYHQQTRVGRLDLDAANPVSNLPPHSNLNPQENAKQERISDKHSLYSPL